MKIVAISLMGLLAFIFSAQFMVDLMMSCEKSVSSSLRQAAKTTLYCLVFFVVCSVSVVSVVWFSSWVLM